MHPVSQAPLPPRAPCTSSVNPHRQPGRQERASPRCRDSGACLGLPVDARVWMQTQVSWLQSPVGKPRQGQAWTLIPESRTGKLDVSSNPGALSKGPHPWGPRFPRLLWTPNSSSSSPWRDHHQVIAPSPTSLCPLLKDCREDSVG